MKPASRSIPLALALFALPFALALMPARVASAHTLLMYPPPLTSNDNAKSGPCGCEFGGDPACPASVPKTDLVAGEMVTIKWKETVQHNGSFRLAFSTKSVQQVTGNDLEGTILYDKADANSMAGATLTTTVAVPNTPCESCTLQLRQNMGGAQPYYFSCASIRILDGSAASSSSASASSSASSGSGSPGEGGSGGEDPGEDPGEDTGEGGSTGAGLAVDPPRIGTGGGCSVGNAPASMLGLLALGGLSLIARARRRRG